MTALLYQLIKAIRVPGTKEAVRLMVMGFAQDEQTAGEYYADGEVSPFWFRLGVRF